MGRLIGFSGELQSLTTDIEFATSVNGTPAVETTTVRSGAAAIRINNTSVIENIHHQVATAQGVRRYRAYIRVVAWPTTARAILFINNSSNRKVEIRLETDAGGHHLELWNGEDGTQVGGDSSALSLDTWYRVEFKVDSTTLASTSVEAKLDGAAAFASGTMDLSVDPNRFVVGCTNADATLDIIYDDIAVNDDSGSFENDYPGEGEQIMLRPSAAGDNAQWTRGGTDSGANWSQVEEIPPDDATTYVQSNTSGEIDDYNLDATPAALASDDVINVVQVGVRFAVSATTGGDPDFVLRIKDSGGTLEESANVSGAGDTFYRSYRTASPRNYALTLYDLPGASATAWTKTELDAAQIGIRESATDTHFARVSAIWLLVDHKPASGASPQTITMDTLTLAGSAVTSDVVPGGVSLTMDTLTLAGSAQALAVTATVTVTMDTLTLVSAPQALTVVPGAISIPLDTLSLASSIQVLDVQPGAVTVLLSTLTLAGTPVSISVSTASNQTVTADTLTLIATAVALQVLGKIKRQLLSNFPHMPL